MFKNCILILFIFYATIAQAQAIAEIPLEPEQDSIKRNAFVKGLGNGYIQTKYFNFDLRYLIKYNQIIMKVMLIFLLFILK